MNIFVLDQDPKKCAKYHGDKHVVKMILEHAQMMSTVATKHGLQAPYRPTHKNHPCTLWLEESIENWQWLSRMTDYLHAEWKSRFGHYTRNHKSWEAIQNTPVPSLPAVPRTPFAQCMPPSYKHSDPVQAYRAYYMGEKRDLAVWTGNVAPSWWK